MLARVTKTAQQHRLAALQLGLLGATALGLRLIGLGYSDFQGDEISALCVPSGFKSLAHFLVFLLGQRKGPVQYLVTCATDLIDPAFSSQLLARLPFAAASLLAVVCFFVLAWRLFDFTTGVYAALLLATHGLFVAFGRIVQYQSLVVLGVTASLMAMTLALKAPRWRVAGLYLAFTAAAAGILAHFDAVFVLPPLGVLTYSWWKMARRQPDFNRLRFHLVAALGLFLLLILGFYVEYVIRLRPSLLNYWGSRFAGPTTNTLRMLEFYLPSPVVWLTLALGCYGLFQIRRNLAGQALLAWLLPPLAFMELIFKDSRTHAYTYVLPALLVAGLGVKGVIEWAERRAGPRGRLAANVGGLVVVLLAAYGSFAVLIDHHPEYPWQPKRVLGVEMSGGNLTGTFGFPYARGWRQIGAWFDSLGEQPVTVVTNEKPEIAGFYLPPIDPIRYSSLDAPEAPPQEVAVYVLQVEGPQSWFDRLWGWPLKRWITEIAPIKVFVDDQGQPTAWVWLLNSGSDHKPFLCNPIGLRTSRPAACVAHLGPSRRFHGERWMAGQPAPEQDCGC